MDLTAVVQKLCEQVPEAIGAIICDFEGEGVVWAFGRAEVPAGAERNARSRIPQTLETSMSLPEFLLRITGAEPCALLRMFAEKSHARGLGAIRGLDLRFEEMDLLVRPLPEDYYVMLALRRPAIRAAAGARLDVAERALSQLMR